MQTEMADMFPTWVYTADFFEDLYFTHQAIPVMPLITVSSRPLLMRRFWVVTGATWRMQAASHAAIM
jgi:hypothetical protein